jgi:hypothetical protein
MKCKLCDENFNTHYRIPRNLNCGHCFCEQCLKIYQKSGESIYIVCPNCSQISPNNLPICYAIYELIDGEDYYSKNAFCSIHLMESIEFFCKDDNSFICVKCAVTDHQNHNFYSTRVYQ